MIRIGNIAGLVAEVARRPFTLTESRLVHYIAVETGNDLSLTIEKKWNQIELALGAVGGRVLNLNAQRLIRDQVLRRELLNTTGLRGGRNIRQLVGLELRTNCWVGREPFSEQLQDVASDEGLLVTALGDHYSTTCPQCPGAVVIRPGVQRYVCLSCGNGGEGEDAVSRFRSWIAFTNGQKKARANG